MSTYVIGDVQGCYKALHTLLDKCRFDPTTDRLWLVGDLVNRGPQSLQVLRFLRDLGRSVTAVLGNHDLFLLMIAAGGAPLQKDSTLTKVLEADDRDELLHWLAHRPLIHVDKDVVMVHAGLLPTWTVSQAQALAEEVHQALTGSNSKTFLRHLIGSQPDHWDDRLKGWDRLRVIVNVFARLRLCSLDGRMNLKAKGPPENAPTGMQPWFKVPGRLSKTHTIVFGHWSALGFYRGDGVVCLDTGYVWGGRLTAMRLEDGEILQVKK